MSQQQNQMNEADILIEHGVVITMDSARRILWDGSVAISAGRIIAVGSTKELAGTIRAQRVIDARRKAVLPGFVDTHHHCMQAFFKGSSDDCALEEWIDNESAPRICMAVDDYAHDDPSLEEHATRVGCAEALLCGITTLLNMEWATPASLIDIYEEIGIRAVHTLTMTDHDQWDRPGMLMPMDNAWSLSERLIERASRSRDGRVTFRYALACPNSCTTELMQEVRRQATARGVGIHIHIAETKFEWDNMHALYGKTPVQYLESIGLLGPDVLGAHCIWLDDDDIQIMARTGTTVAHCPECNMKVADGAAPIAKMLKAGVVVSVATDSCAVNDNMDMLEAARTAAFLQKLTHNDPAVISGAQALEMATLGGARALGMGDELGSLEAGKKADVILIDLTGAHLRPIHTIANNLVYSGSATHDVHTVIVDGKIVVEDRELLTMDAEKLLSDAEAYNVKRSQEAGLYVSPYYTTHLGI